MPRSRMLLLDAKGDFFALSEEIIFLVHSEGLDISFNFQGVGSRC